MHAGVTAAFAFAGFIIGSFLNVVIHRLPRGQSLVAPGSRCPHCSHTLSAIDNIPIISWISLGGHCRYCRAPISPRYPLVELATAGLFALAALELGLSIEGIAVAAFAAALLAVAFIDLDHLLIPDGLNVALAIVGVIAAIASHRFLPALEGAVSSGALVGALYLITRGTGMGLGDVKLAAVIGLFLGFPAGPLATLAAFVIGAALAIPVLLGGQRGRRDALPFGPFLVLGALVATYAPSLIYGPMAAYRVFVESHVLRS